MLSLGIYCSDKKCGESVVLGNFREDWWLEDLPDEWLARCSHGHLTVLSFPHERWKLKVLNRETTD